MANQHLTDQQIFDLTAKLKSEQAESQPLASDKEPIAALAQEYSDASSVYQSKIQWLQQHAFSSIRRFRRDGSCFYRSLSYALLEQSVTSADLAQSLSVHLKSLLPSLDAVGFQKDIYEDFSEPFFSLLEKASSSNETPGELHQSLNDPEITNAIVVFLRLITSAWLDAHFEDFYPFLFALDNFQITGDGKEDMTRFRQSFVEAMDQDADTIQISALTQALKISIKIAYLDQSASGESAEGHVNFHSFPDTQPQDDKAIYFLYRPGHYDLIYKD